MSDKFRELYEQNKDALGSWQREAHMSLRNMRDASRRLKTLSFDLKNELKKNKQTPPAIQKEVERIDKLITDVAVKIIDLQKKAK